MPNHLEDRFQAQSANELDANVQSWDVETVWCREVYAFLMVRNEKPVVILAAQNMSRKQVCAVLMDLLGNYVNLEPAQRLRCKVGDALHTARRRNCVLLNHVRSKQSLMACARDTMMKISKGMHRFASLCNEVEVEVMTKQ
jgi:hypothetical protein